MTGDWTAVALTMGILALLAAAVGVVLMLRVQRTLVARQQELENQSSALDDAIRMLEARLAALHSPLPGAPGEEVDAELEAALGDVAAAQEMLQPEIQPEIQAVIAAAATMAAGPKARLNAVRLVKSHEDSSAWSQQGRMLVQTSHNLR